MIAATHHFTHEIAICGTGGIELAVIVLIILVGLCLVLPAIAGVHWLIWGRRRKYEGKS